MAEPESGRDDCCGGRAARGGEGLEVSALALMANEQSGEAVAFLHMAEGGGEPVGGPRFQRDVGETGGGTQDIPTGREALRGQKRAGGGPGGAGQREVCGHRDRRAAQQRGGEAKVALRIGLVGGDGDLLRENLSGVELQLDAKLGGEKFIVGIGPEGDVARGRGDGGEGDLEPVPTRGGGGHEVGVQRLHEAAEPGEFDVVRSGTLGERVERGGEKLDPGSEQRSEIDVRPADEDTQTRGRPSGPQRSQRGREQDEVAEGVELEEEGDCGSHVGGARGHGTGAGARSTCNSRAERRRVSGAGRGKSAGASKRSICGVTEAGIRTITVA